MHGDNVGAICLAHNMKKKHRTKRIDTHYHLSQAGLGQCGENCLRKIIQEPSRSLHQERGNGELQKQHGGVSGVGRK